MEQRTARRLLDHRLTTSQPVSFLLHLLCMASSIADRAHGDNILVLCSPTYASASSIRGADSILGVGTWVLLSLRIPLGCYRPSPLVAG